MELAFFTLLKSILFLLVCAIKLNDNNENLYTIERYDAFHNIRCNGRRGGGLSVYISNVFKSEVILLCTISLLTIETLFNETVKENCRLRSIYQFTDLQVQILYFL